MPAETLLRFALANDAAAATTKKLQKQAALAGYLREIESDEDLRRAVRYCAGRAFAATTERVLNVGGATVSRVVMALLGIDAQTLHQAIVRSGEMGEALAVLWDQRDGAMAAGSQTPDRPAGVDALTLEEVERAFDELAATGRSERKEEILHALLGRCVHPREAAYVAKIIFRDMRTGVQEGVLQAAIAQAFDRPLAEVQRCQLLVGDIDEVAVLARHDAMRSAAFRLFHPIQFMLAAAQETADEAAGTIGGRVFQAEEKLDGIRAQIHKSGERIAIYSRTMDRVDGSFPDVVAQVSALPGDLLLDGEIVPWRDGAVLPFAHIQRRLGRKALTPRVLRENPCAFVAFDILYRDGELLLDRPLRERRAVLNELCEACRAEVAAGETAEPVGRPMLLTTAVREVTTAADIEQAFELARAARNEGLVLKDPQSPYAPGRRGKTWLKLKTHLPTLDCVVTAAEIGNGKRRHHLSDYTFAVWDRDPAEEDATLVNVGKAYIGMTDAEIEQLTELFGTITVEDRGRVKIVRPQVVLEIACDQIQKSDRHASGYALRFPRIKRIRWDKRPEDADRLARVIELYESNANFGRRSAEAAQAEPTLFDHLL